MTTTSAPPPAVTRQRSGSQLRPVVLVTVPLVALSLYWSSYYLAEPAVRVRDPMHPWLRPSGYIGQSAGIVALLIFVFLWLYPLRKKVRWLRWTGAISKWLDVHIMAALTIPLITAIHAGWRFEGLIGLGYWSMIVVCASGVIGRYLYVHIPRSANGLELTAEEITTERRGLLDEVAASSGIPRPQIEDLLRPDSSPREQVGVLRTFHFMWQDAVSCRKATRTLGRILQNRPGKALDRVALRRVVQLARREMALTQQARMLHATQRVFRLWHVAHRPFAIAALVAVVVHVGVAIAMGMTWF